MINPMELTGKHILITGASQGIGQATAILASKLGAKLSLLARNEEKLNATLMKLEGTEHRIFPFDLTKIEDIDGMIGAVVKTCGPLDGMVNCAGIAPNRPLNMVKQAFLREVFDINFYPFIELMRVISKKKNCNDGASLIGISSVAALKGNKSQTAYTASKAAIAAVVQPVAKELADRRIRVNAVAFGMIDTGMYQYFLEMGGHNEEFLQQQYLGIGKPEDAANALCFLLSDAASFITGTTMIVDGGCLS